MTDNEFVTELMKIYREMCHRKKAEAYQASGNALASEYHTKVADDILASYKRKN